MEQITTKIKWKFEERKKKLLVAGSNLVTYKLELIFCTRIYVNLFVKYPNFA